MELGMGDGGMEWGGGNGIAEEREWNRRAGEWNRGVRRGGFETAGNARVNLGYISTTRMKQKEIEAFLH